MQALLSVFKGRAVDPNREKDTAVERCDVSVEDGEERMKSRFVIKIVCRHGMLHGMRHFQTIDMPRCSENIQIDFRVCRSHACSFR